MRSSQALRQSSVSRARLESAGRTGRRRGFSRGRVRAARGPCAARRAPPAARRTLPCCTHASPVQHVTPPRPRSTRAGAHAAPHAASQHAAPVQHAAPRSRSMRHRTPAGAPRARGASRRTARRPWAPQRGLHPPMRAPRRRAARNVDERKTEVKAGDERQTVEVVRGNEGPASQAVLDDRFTQRDHEVPSTRRTVSTECEGIDSRPRG